MKVTADRGRMREENECVCVRACCVCVCGALAQESRNKTSINHQCDISVYKLQSAA